MAKAADSVLDEDLQEELRKLAERSGRSLGALANAALRDYARYENQDGASFERGLADLDAGRTRTTDDCWHSFKSSVSRVVGDRSGALWA